MTIHQLISQRIYLQEQNRATEVQNILKNIYTSHHYLLHKI